MNGEMEEFDEKEKERRKQSQIEYNKKKSASNIFLFFGTIIEIILSLACVMGLVLLVAVITLKWLNLPDTTKGTIFNILSVVALIGGLFLGFIIYKSIGRWVIRKWKLEDKLKDEVLNQFKTRKEFKEYYEKKQQR
jgi:hypothetical protein